MFKPMDWLRAIPTPQGLALKLSAAGLFVLALLALLYALTDKIADGGEAIGREKQRNEQVENVTTELQARKRVTDCFASGGLWNDQTRKCDVQPVR